MNIFWYVAGFMFVVGGLVPFLWVFVPDSHAGCESSAEAEEWGAYLLKRNKRQAPQICADSENPASWA